MKISCLKEESDILSDGDSSLSSPSLLSPSSTRFETRFADGSSPQIEISPGTLDWGVSILFSPTEIFLTVINSHNDEVLTIQKPFSSDPQFYASGSWPLSLKPQESTSISVIFLPSYVGTSSSHLVIQTNRGGFIIHARGTAIQSPYRFKPLLGFQQGPDGSLKEFLSLHNPMEKGNILVEEVRARVAVLFNDRSSHSVQVICKRENFLSLEVQKFWFSLGEEGSGDFFMGLRPLKKWEISPQSSDTLMEISFFSSRERNISGSIYLKLRTSVHGKDDVVVLPLEAQIRNTSPIGPISIFFDISFPCDGKRKPTFYLYIRNGEQYPLKLEEVFEVNGDLKLFEIKSIEGLILYPGTVTLVALMKTSASFSLIAENQNCKLIALTNQTISPQLEFLCRDLVKSESMPGCERSSTEKEHQHIKVQFLRKEKFPI